MKYMKYQMQIIPSERSSQGHIKIAYKFIFNTIYSERGEKGGGLWG